VQAVATGATITGCGCVGMHFCCGNRYSAEGSGGQFQLCSLSSPRHRAAWLSDSARQMSGMRERMRIATGSFPAPWGHVVLFLLPEQMPIDIHPAYLLLARGFWASHLGFACHDLWVETLARIAVRFGAPWFMS